MRICLLCSQYAAEIEPGYSHCSVCDLRFLHRDRHLTAVEESLRYDLHENDSRDPAYQHFVRPAVDLIKNRFSPPAFGLDFGCGADSAVTRLLREAQFEMAVYDPKYFPNEKPLATQYDFVVATEVIEHLHQPNQVLKKWRSLLKPNGAVVLMTHLYSEKVDFASWYYRRDPTHVAFYSARTFDWICEHFQFSNLEINDERTVWLQAR